MESIKEPGDDIATESTEGAINKKVTDTVDHVWLSTHNSTYSEYVRMHCDFAH